MEDENVTRRIHCSIRIVYHLLNLYINQLKSSRENISNGNNDP